MPKKHHRWHMGMLRAIQTTGSRPTLAPRGRWLYLYSKKGLFCRGLYSGHALSHGPISSTALYNTLQQLYTLQPLVYTTPQCPAWRVAGGAVCACGPVVGTGRKSGLGSRARRGLRLRRRSHVGCRGAACGAETRDRQTADTRDLTRDPRFSIGTRRGSIAPPRSPPRRRVPDTKF